MLVTIALCFLRIHGSMTAPRPRSLGDWNCAEVISLLANFGPMHTALTLVAEAAVDGKTLQRLDMRLDLALEFVDLTSASTHLPSTLAAVLQKPPSIIQAVTSSCARLHQSFRCHIKAVPV